MINIDLAQDGDNFRLTCPHPEYVIEYMTILRELRPSLDADGTITFTSKDHRFVDQVMRQLFGLEERTTAVIFLYDYLSGNSDDVYRHIWLGGRLLAYRDSKTDTTRFGEGVRVIAGGFEDDTSDMRYFLPPVKPFTVLEVEAVGAGIDLHRASLVSTDVMWLSEFVDPDFQMSEKCAGWIENLRSQIRTVQALERYLDAAREKISS